MGFEAPSSPSHSGILFLKTIAEKKKKKKRGKVKAQGLAGRKAMGNELKTLDGAG